eukprot:1328783-Amorphochlora_amoeboformis.AAC.2
MEKMLRVSRGRRSGLECVRGVSKYLAFHCTDFILPVDRPGHGIDALDPIMPISPQITPIENLTTYRDIQSHPPQIPFISNKPVRILSASRSLTPRAATRHPKYHQSAKHTPHTHQHMQTQQAQLKLNLLSL